MTAAEATPLAHPGAILIPGIHDNNSDDESISDNRSNYNINDTAFLEGGMIDIVDEVSDGEEEINVMGLGILGPDAVDPYNGPHVLRPGILSSFTAVL
eukprot:403420-Ditylum_brightwellii.AAC.1